MAIRVVALLLIVWPAFADELAGSIKSALVVFPPYGDAVPTILFQFTDGRLRLVKLGEALVTRRDSRGLVVPVAYKFLGCEREWQTGRTYFVFDVDCDGRRIVEMERRSGKVRPWRLKRRYLLPEGGVLRPTREGWTYFRDQGRRLLGEVELAPVVRLVCEVQEGVAVSRVRRAGLRIVRIRARSALRELGLLDGDVILSINGFVPRNGLEVVAVVRREVRHGVLSVRIRRAGEVRELLFDTRPPRPDR